MTVRETFEQVEQWIENLMSKAEPDIQVILVGNKIDKVRQNPSCREVEKSEALALAEKNNFQFIETSAFAQENVSSAFEQLLEAVSQVRERKQKQFGQTDIMKSNQCLRLHDPELEEKEKGCCS